MKKQILCTLALTGMLAGTALAQPGDPPYLLAEGTWVCTTPEAYDDAVAKQENTKGYSELMELKDRLLAEKLCMYVDDEDIEDMMAPFVEIVERNGDKVKVTFWIEFYKRIAYLHRTFSRVKFAGWTAVSRLTEYHPVGG